MRGALQTLKSGHRVPAEVCETRGRENDDCGNSKVQQRRKMVDLEATVGKRAQSSILLKSLISRCGGDGSVTCILAGTFLNWDKL